MRLGYHQCARDAVKRLLLPLSIVVVVGGAALIAYAMRDWLRWVGVPTVADFVTTARLQSLAVSENQALHDPVALFAPGTASASTHACATLAAQAWQVTLQCEGGIATSTQLSQPLAPPALASLRAILAAAAQAGWSPALGSTLPGSELQHPRSANTGFYIALSKQRGSITCQLTLNYSGTVEAGPLRSYVAVQCAEPLEL